MDFENFTSMSKKEQTLFLLEDIKSFIMVFGKERELTKEEATRAYEGLRSRRSFLKKVVKNEEALEFYLFLYDMCEATLPHINYP